MKFVNWSTEAIKGYVVMLNDFISGSNVVDEKHKENVKHLYEAINELDKREQVPQKTPKSKRYKKEKILKEESEIKTKAS